MGRQGPRDVPGRAGSLGDAMERAEADLTIAAAQNCRTPADYSLWRMVGMLAVDAARRMTQEQRAVFAASVERAIGDARDVALSNAPHRLQQALGFAPSRVKPDLGFDDED